MISPVNDWVGDEYDDIIEAFERVDRRMMAEKQLKESEVTDPSRAIDERDDPLKKG